MRDWLATTLILFGAAFMLLAAIGVWRFPDFFSRMQAAAKAGTLGVGLLVLGAAVHFGRFSVTAHAILIVVFLVMTAPVAAHRIARAAHRIGVPLWSGTRTDELRAATRAEPSVATFEDAGHPTPPGSAESDHHRGSAGDED